MAHAICCSSCKILKRGVEGAGDRDHRNPEDVSLGPEPFRSPDICPPRQEASARAGARFADVTSLFIANKSPCALQLSPQAPTGLLGVTALHELAERRRARARSHTATLSVCWQ